MRIIIVTGLAGGGKTTALRALEDLGFYCCDNLPVSLFSQFIDNLENKKITNCAVSVDGRQVGFIDEYLSQIEASRKSGHQLEILFLEAADPVLFRRYSETRRRHPLSSDDVKEGIRQDREALSVLREQATIINTGGLNVHEIKEIITQRYQSNTTSLSVVIQSFGFKYGLPAESELVFDVRYLLNPYFDEVLKPQDGRDRDVSAFVFSSQEGKDTLKHIESFLEFSLPLYQREGKAYVTVGIGCTGGKHRSVALVEALRGRLEEKWHVIARHRDLAKSVTRRAGE